jgi:hypothetical protein
MTKYRIQGGGEIDLNPRQFLAKGGEGAVYAKGQVAYKIYLDEKKMIPPAKIKELAVLQHPNIVRPELLLLDKKNKPVGYTMKLLKDVIPLCQLFTKAFHQRNGITPEKMIELVQKLQELIIYIHSRNIIVVDLNEFNFLCDDTFQQIFGIDVNSYQTPSFPATAIMDSIRDRHAKKFNTDTDWFSWAIITFQMLIGVHPYKGSHPNFLSLPKKDRLDARMKQNISVFHSDSMVPGVCQPFDVIPNTLRQWYVALFEKGKRLAPPRDFDAAIELITKIKEIVGSNLFNIELVETYQDDILDYHCSPLNRVVVLPNDVYVGKRHCQKFWSGKYVIGFMPITEDPIVAYLENGNLQLFNLGTYKSVGFTGSMNGDVLMQCEGRIYLKNGTSIIEVGLHMIGAEIRASFNQVGNVLDMATKVFPGVILQILLNRYIVSIFPETGRCFQIGVQELDGYRLVDAKYENNVLMIVGEKSGQYDRFVLRFKDHQSYHLRKVENITHTGLNFTVNDAGVCMMINEDEKVEAFSHLSNTTLIKMMEDPAINADMRLFHDGTAMLFAQGKKLYKISMK